MENQQDIYAIEKQMKEINARLKQAADAYYNGGDEIMSNYEYDALYDELMNLERENGVVLPDSITASVGYEVSSTLPKEKHATRMLSLSKTKSKEELKAWLGEQDGCLSWKLDGSTVVLTYDKGRLVKAVTRGNGEIGEVITAQALKFANIPEKIAFKGELVVRGEALMSYSEFERINALMDETKKYKNPRNLASGTMRAIDTSILDERKMLFYAFTLISAAGHPSIAGSYALRLDWLASLGFDVVEHKIVNSSSLEDVIEEFASRVSENDFPSDGLVVFYDDIVYGESLGSTSHAPRNGMAFKWKDETQATTIRDIIWSPSRTGRLNPVAVFDAVELEGTTVERASVHNISYIEEMRLNIGDEVAVFKANMIIPQIAENLTHSLDSIESILPKACPSCGKNELERRNDSGSDFLYCANPSCPAKIVGRLEHFASRDAMNIIGLSSETIRKLVSAGFVSCAADLFFIKDRKDDIVSALDGFQDKMFTNLVESIETARSTTCARFLYSLGIKEIGRSASKAIAGYFHDDMEAILKATDSELTSIDGIGSIMASEFTEFISSHREEILRVLDCVHIEDSSKSIADANDKVSGKIFVITGSLTHFENRDELSEAIEAQGGKVSSSVSKKTDYLITNTPDSGSAKNKKARELGVSVITEDEIVSMLG